MDNNRKTAIIVGVLFIIATAFLFMGRAIYEPVLYAADYLETAYQNRTAAIVGMLVEFACVLAIPLIPVFLFPVLRKHNEALALGYFGFRFFEAILFVLVQITTKSPQPRSTCWADSTIIRVACSHSPRCCSSSISAKSTETITLFAECMPPNFSRTTWLVIL